MSVIEGMGVEKLTNFKMGCDKHIDWIIRYNYMWYQRTGFVSSDILSYSFMPCSAIHTMLK